MNRISFFKQISILSILFSVSSISIACPNTLEKGCREFLNYVHINQDSIVEIKAKPQEISFLFMGDFMMHEPQINSAKDSVGNYDYNHYFDYTKSLIKGVDFSIANLEVTLAGAPYSGYPRFCAPDEYAIAIQNAGIDILTTANNHSNDKGSAGLVRTINYLDSLNIPHLGTYKDSDERENKYPLIVEKDGIRVALLNYTYGTNGVSTKPPHIVNMINEELMLGDLEKVQNMNVDKIIAIAHWGTEYLSFPDKYQKKWGEWLFEHGVDVVIGGHPHWVQPVELRTDSVGYEQLIVWSLGNIISNQQREHTDGGSSLQFTLFRDSLNNVRFKDVGYHLHWVWVKEEKGQKKYHILPVTKAEKLDLDLSEQSRSKLNLFINNERTLYNTHNLAVPEYQYDKDKDTYSTE